MLNKILNYKTQLYKLLLFSGFILWGYLVRKYANYHEFNNDEIWAWNIAHDLSFNEIVQLMHYEGHSFLWYMILKPFTLLADKIPPLFPYILKWINLFFLGIAMFLLWMFSPINIFLKILITITSPFVVTYPSLGRQYGLLILLLFVIVMIYKDRLKHPLVYSVILFLLAHTCWNGLVGAIFFSVFFIYDLYKDNKTNLCCSKFLVPVFVVCSAYIMLAIEWIPLFPPMYIEYHSTWYYFLDFFVPREIKYYGLISMIILGPVLQAAAIIQYSTMKDKWFLLFGAYIFYSFIIFYLAITMGKIHHLYFIYIYFIIIYWLLLDNSEEFVNNKLNYYSTSLVILLISVLYLIPFRDPRFWFENEENVRESSRIIREIIPKNSRVYLILEFGTRAITDFKNDFDLRTHYNHKIPSLRAYQAIYQDFYLRPEDIYVKDGEKAYYIVSHEYLNSFGLHKDFIGNTNCRYLKDVYVVCVLYGRGAEKVENELYPDEIVSTVEENE